MRSLSTELRCAFLRILTDKIGFENLTDQDFGFVSVIDTYANNRNSSADPAADLKKMMYERDQRRMDAATGATGLDSKRADWPGPARTGPVGEPGIKGDVGAIGAIGSPLPPIPPPAGANGPAGPQSEVLPTTAPPNADDQAKLPLAPADRGPEPQDASSLLDTTAPEIDPSDPPPDYTQLNTAATRRIDA